MESETVMIKAIETEYKGYRFRSRLEARWAVFFDAFEINWTYESEGFELPSGRYLPDFYFTDWECWVEIKPTPIRESKQGHKTKRELRLCAELACAQNKIVLLVGGQPGLDETGLPEYRVALFAPDMILQSQDETTSPNGIRFDYLLSNFYDILGITEGYFTLSHRLYGFIYQRYQEHPDWFTDPMPERGDAWGLIKADRIYFQKQYGREHPRWLFGIMAPGFIFEWNTRTNRPHAYLAYLHQYDYESSARTEQALSIARGARFEHGESPLDLLQSAPF